MSSKCVNKLHPGEKMGAFVNEGGRTAIVEYTEVDSVIVEGDQDRDHALRAGNVAIHVIDLGFVERVTEGELRLPLHIAHKAIPHVDSSGNKVEPDSPNGYKIETFIFDALHLTDDTIIMETRRSEEFSPLKNRSGADSIETVERDQVALFAGWLEHAGIEVPRENSAPRFRIEVSPLFAPTGQEFLDRAGELEVDRIEGDTYVE
jgi:UDP-N-acetylglucosamine/UDP-N-acetylgalactosamine diphosphorylase